MTDARTKPHQRYAVIASLICLGMMLANCTRPQGIFPNGLDDDLRERHLVKQQARTQSLTIVPIGPKQDQISLNDVERITAFVEDYKQSGLDSLKITYAGSHAVQPALAALLGRLGETQTVTSNGKARLGMIEIQLSYTANEAVLDRDCQGRHTDGGMTFMVPNKSMGCAFTLAVAKQINDPRDMSEPHALEKKFNKAGTSNSGTKTSGDTQVADSPIKGPDSILSGLR